MTNAVRVQVRNVELSAENTKLQRELARARVFLVQLESALGPVAKTLSLDAQRTIGEPMAALREELIGAQPKRVACVGKMPPRLRVVPSAPVDDPEQIARDLLSIPTLDGDAQ